MVLQFLCIFGSLVSVIAGISQLEPRFNSDFAKQQYTDISTQTRIKMQSDGADERVQWWAYYE